MNRRLSFLLLAALLLQAVLAPAQGLAMARHGFALEICTADGLKTIHQQPDGAPAEPGHAGACLACHALPAGAALDPPPLPAPAWTNLAAPPPALPAGRLPPGIRGPPGGARAPPPVS
ncbi:DUF2946 family protein [Belnapia moabensis]|uniref:DUF2946 family protein n=1 Tax=Belnapia moabensis TaxID=365533 RepID=UPI0005BD01C7|nr:DUF2946 family protein [Belnapia moabensis]